MCLSTTPKLMIPSLYSSNIQRPGPEAEQVQKLGSRIGSSRAGEIPRKVRRWGLRIIVETTQIGSELHMDEKKPRTTEIPEGNGEAKEWRPQSVP